MPPQLVPPPCADVAGFRVQSNLLGVAVGVLRVAQHRMAQQAPGAAAAGAAALRRTWQDLGVQSNLLGVAVGVLWVAQHRVAQQRQVPPQLVPPPCAKVVFLGFGALHAWHEE